ncbi:MAG: META domain-containing protein [Anaerolineae bacterium]
MRRIRPVWAGTVVILLAALLLAACEPRIAPPVPGGSATPTVVPTQPTMPPSSTLAGTEWVLESLQGQPVLADTQITLSFGAEQATGYSGCNQYGGSYTATQEKLTIQEIASTLMFCEGPEGVMEQEAAYLDTLGHVEAFALEEDGRLTLSSGEGAVLSFARVEELPMDPADLIGTAWRLTRMDGEPPVPGTTITLAFPEAGRLEGHAGWRDYQGQYEAEGDDLHLTFLEMATELRLVPEAAMQQEARFSTRLGQTTHYRLSEDGLEILTAPGQPLLFEPLPEGVDPYEPTTWVLEAFVDGEQTTPALEGSRVTAIIDADMVQGRAGCNSYSAEVSFDGSFLTIGPAMRTEMACLEPEGVMEQEDRFLDTLSQVTIYRVEGEGLRLEAETGRTLVLRAES